MVLFLLKKIKNQINQVIIFNNLKKEKNEEKTQYLIVTIIEKAMDEGNVKKLDSILCNVNCSPANLTKIITPLFFKVFDVSFPHRNNIEIPKCLLKYGADPNNVCPSKLANTCDAWGFSIIWNNTEITKILATSGCVNNLEIFNSSDDEQIKLSLHNSFNYKMTKTLIALGLSKNDLISYRKDGNLVFAILLNDIETVKYLIINGADLNKEIGGKKPPEYARSVEMLDFLTINGAICENQDELILNIKEHEERIKQKSLEKLNLKIFPKQSNEMEQSTNEVLVKTIEAEKAPNNKPVNILVEKNLLSEQKEESFNF